MGVMYAASAEANVPERYTGHFVDVDSIDCSSFDSAWAFRDDFVDTYDIVGTVYFGADGEPVRVVEHWRQRSDDVNSVTGFTLHEHNRYVVIYDLVKRTRTFNGANNVMQRPGVGSVIRWTGHKVYPLDSDVPIKFAGPAIASDEDFCRSIA
jgi:hypothetical protein